MPNVTFLCPIDSLTLAPSVFTVEYVGNDPQGQQVDAHVHVEIHGTFTCTNNHEWSLENDLLFVRQV